MCTYLNYTDSNGDINPSILQKLKDINKEYTKSKDHNAYSTALSILFDLEPLNQIRENEKLFLAGFIEGEGSMNIGAKVTPSAALGLCIDPEFSITQSIFGVNQLYKALVLFRTGRISYKAESKATLVFRIDNRTSLKEVVIPFYNNYVRPYSSDKKVNRLDIFIKLLESFDLNYHIQYRTMIETILPLWDMMRMQKGQKNEAFATLKEAQDYVTTIAIQKKII